MTKLRTVQLSAVLMLFGLCGCSMQDFGGIGGIDVGGPADTLDEAMDAREAEERANKLAELLADWQRRRYYRDEDFRVGPDDTLSITIHSLEQPGVPSVLERLINRDGLISLPHTGDLDVNGMTARRIEQAIVEAYEGRYLKDPRVSVEILDYRSAPVYVTGAVQMPGVYHLKHNSSSVLEILSLANGLAPTHGNELIIVRDRSHDSSSVPRKSAARTPAEPGDEFAPAATNNVQGGLSPEISDASETGPTNRLAQSDPASMAGDSAEAALQAGEEAMPNADAMESRRDEPLASGDEDALSGESGKKPRRRGFFGLFRGNTQADDARAEATAEETGGPAEPPAADDGPGEPDASDRAPAPEIVGLAPVEDEASADVMADEMGVEMISVDLDRLLDTGDIRHNAVVLAGDVISVPPARKEYVYVLGFVQRPGKIEIPGEERVDAIQAVAMAGGLGPAARAENSTLIAIQNGRRKNTSVNLARISRGKAPPVYMQPGDTLIVGSSTFAKIAEFIRFSVGGNISPMP